MSKLQGGDLVKGWVLRPFVEVLNEIKQSGTEIDMFGFNLKTSTDEPTPNTAYFGLDEMSNFVSAYTMAVTLVESPHNQATPPGHRFYYLPYYLVTRKDDNENMRVFPTMEDPRKGTYMPVFDNLKSFVSWYEAPTFGDVFVHYHGQVTPTVLSALKSSDNVLDGIDGVAINAINDEDHLIKFDENFDELTQLPNSNSNDERSPGWSLPE